MSRHASRNLSGTRRIAFPMQFAEFPLPWPFLLVLVLFGASPAAAADADDLPLPESVAPELYATGFEFAEGPALDAAGNLFVVNYRGLGNIGRIAADGTASVWCSLAKLAPINDRRVQANGLKVDREGRLVVADAGGGRLLRVSVDGTQVEVLADRFEGTRLNAVNDVALDARGNIYFTDPGGSSGENPVGAVYRFDIGTKKVTRVAGDLAFPNGLAVTPDQKSLCVAESGRFRVLMFDLASPSEPQRVVIEFPEADTGEFRGGKFAPDGMVFDARSRLYVAMWNGGVVNVVDVAGGRLLRQYRAGGEQVTNCHFHGDYLYTTVASKEAVFRLKLGVPGFNYNHP